MSKELEARPIKLDLHDKKLLTYVLHDIRTPLSEIAKRIGISLPRAHYKLTRLKQELITPTVIINYPALGIPVHVLFFETLSNELARLLQQAPEVFSFMQSIGRYEYALIVVGDLSSFCAERIPRERPEVHPIIALYPDDYDAFQLQMKLDPIKRTAPMVSLESVDYQILHYFSRQPEQSYLRASQDLGIDRLTIKRHIDRLIESNIIMRFRLAFNPIKLGRSNYLVRVDVAQAVKRQVREVIEQDSYSGFVFEIPTGFVFWNMPTSHAELFAITRSIRAVDAGARIDVVQHTEEFMVNTVPEAALKIFSERS